MPATMLDVAHLAGVSTATVSRVLNTPELVNEDTRRRVMNSIQQLDYKINVAARRLRTNQTRLIAVVIPTIAEPVINQVVEAIEDAAIAASRFVFDIRENHRDAPLAGHINETFCAGQRVFGTDIQR